MKKRRGIRLWGFMIFVAMTACLLAWDQRQTRTIFSPDQIVVEVDSALVGHPIQGERLVRPYGKIDLGYYGEVAVHGLTPEEAKAKIVTHLRRYLSDEALGLVEHDAGADGQRSPRHISPYQTRRVRVWISVKNSKTGFIDQAFQFVRGKWGSY